MQRILVTGASGNVGREVLAACTAAGLPTRAGSRRPDPHAPDGAESVRLDLTDAATWAPALADCDGLFLLRPPAIADIATTLAPFLDAAAAAGVRRVVFVSVAGAERMAWVPHRKVELHLEASELQWTTLRPGFFAQNLQDAYRRDIVEDSRLYVPAGDGRVAFLDVRDMGEVAARLFASPGSHTRAYLHLTGPVAVGFDEVASTLSGVLGRPVRYLPASIPGYLLHLLRRRRLRPMQAAVQTYLHVGLRRGDAAPVIDTLPELLGRPATPLSEYVARSRALWLPDA